MPKHKKGFKRSCFKRGYKSKRKTKGILSTLRKKGRDETRFYYCRDCQEYHLTSTKRRLLFDDDDETED